MSDHTFLWLLRQYSNRGLNTFDSCVVAADTIDDAKQITPDGYPFQKRPPSRWAPSTDNVEAEKIGVTKAERRGTIIISSFNAG